MSRLDELEALLAGATPGPWEVGPIYWSLRIVEKGGYEVHEDMEGNELPDTAKYPCRSDAPLIIALRNIAPKLIAVAREAEEVADEFKRGHPLVKALAALEEP